MMNKEEILEKSRMENRKKDVYEMEVSLRALRYAAIAMCLLALIFYCYEAWTGHGTNPAFFAIIALYNTVLFGVRAIKIPAKRGLNIAMAVFCGILTIAMIVTYLNSFRTI